ncbi:hypothetical protein [Hydrogenophaga sp.]|uniref:hypothetical protein n=1 Tax=Hydrogenophaga sp. TaxID=1904254 RepID=UPI002730EE23|nr:hypothetical protein [Hydrogenophaga sp.]MDP2076296.1 hypothetical protein [Hydrogenophaga sp.]MDP3109797.1 hypothetical protein [Hydrogenophaga sp.]
MSGLSSGDSQSFTPKPNGVVHTLPTYDLLDQSSVWTPEIESLVHVVITQIRLDTPGMLVIGRQRIGKSKALGFVQEVLSEEIGYPILVLSWTIADDDRRTGRAFLQDRMRQSGTDAISHRDLAVLRSRLISHIRADAARLGTKRVAFFVDEAQILIDQEYAQMLFLFNEMERYDLRPFFLLVGQPELLGVKGRWLASGNYQNIGRFATRTHEYSGIRLEELEKVLSGFDDDSDGIEQCVAYKVAPKAFAEGWRISALGPLMVTAVQSVALAHNITDEVRMPMQYLRSWLLAILYHVIQTGIDPRILELHAVIDCLKSTNFGAVLQYHVEIRTEKPKEGTAK